MIYTTENLKVIFPATLPRVIEQFVSPLNATIDKYEINSLKRASAFIAQVGHESQGLTHIMENLNYSEGGLLKTFPRYFNGEQAISYAKKPEKIANRVYANRMGNGDEASGDGWLFRGRGLLQITGRYNYELLAKGLHTAADEITSYLETVVGATISAGWLWDVRKLNMFADMEDTTTITKKINGGLIGFDERLRLYQLAKSILV